MPTRREVAAGIGASLLLGACGQSIIFQREAERPKENYSRAPQLGDMVYYSGIPCLLRSNLAMGISDLPTYLRNSKAPEYGRKVFDNLPDYVIEDIIDRFSPVDVGVDNYFNEFSGLSRRVKPLGGENLVFWPGALTYRGYPLGKDNEPFIHIRERLGRENLNWQLSDCEFFTYGAIPFKDHSRIATLGPVGKIIEDSLDFISILRNEAPFEQQNHIAHSAGGIYAFEAIIRNMDLVNNLILIDVPIRGLKGIGGKVGEAISKLGWTDNLISYLSDLPNDMEYQKRLDKAKEFIKRGGKITIILHEDDPIATEDNAVIEGADVVIIKGGIFKFLNPLSGWNAHGAGLEDSLSLDVIEQKIGRNLASD